jgi:putative metallohydrolase (TIGR04338 family)
MPRDQYRSKLYKAQLVLPISTKEHVPLSVCQDFVNEVTAAAWFKRRYGTCSIEVRDGRGHQQATANQFGKVIQLPLWARTTVIMLHETAHCVTSYKLAAHGKEFATTELALIRHFWSEEAYDKLRKSFIENGVPFLGKVDR